MIKPKVPGFVIVKPEEKDLTVSELLERLDKRDYLDQGYNPTGKKPQLGIILPEQKEKEFDIEETKIVNKILNITLNITLNLIFKIGTREIFSKT